MEFLEIISSTLFATSAMTLFSYVISWLFRKNYKEPVLLEFLMSTFGFKVAKHYKVMASWSLHYFIGLIFVLSYYLPIWLNFNWYTITLFSGFVFGSIIGCIGIVFWKVMFTLSPKDPPTYTSGYYLQLFFAHIILGITTVVVHWMFN